MKEFKISVLMSIYSETENYIREAVESILFQTFSEFELIVVNDNPKRQDVKPILDSYSDSRIRFVQNSSNIGLAMCMNKAAGMARTDIFVRMDADDIALPKRFELEYNELLQSHSDFVFSAYQTMNEKGLYIEKRINNELSDRNKIRKKIAIKPNLIHHPTVMFTREIFKKVGGYRDFPCAQDADLWMRMAEAGCKFSYLPNVLLKYRLNSQGVTHKKWFKQQLTISYIYRLSFERVLKGRDTYSIDNYNRYLIKRGIDNSVVEYKLRQAYNKLRLAKTKNAFSQLRLRFLAFLSSKELRFNYLIVIFKTVLIK